MVIAIMQTTSDRIRTVFRLRTDFKQTSNKLRTELRRQTPTSDFGPWPDFKHQTLDFKLQTLKFRVQKPPLGFNTLNN